MPSWLEYILAFGGGSLALHLFNLAQEYIRGKARQEEKKIIDETEISRTLLEVNQNRFESVLRELEGVRETVGRLEKKTRELEIANLHLRHLLGLGPNDTIPDSKDDLVKFLKEREEESRENEKVGG